jgi:hypothetical protein
MNYRSLFIASISLFLLLSSGCFDDSSSKDNNLNDDEDVTSDYDNKSETNPDDKNDLTDVDDNNDSNDDDGEIPVNYKWVEIIDSEDLTRNDYEMILLYKDDNDDLRTYEPIIFYLKNVPENSNVTWDFGDNNITYGYEINHLYSFSDYYRITVTVRWSNEYKTDSLDISVKNHDIYSAGHSTISLRDPIKRRAHTGLGIREGITVPEAVINLELRNLTGEFIVGVDIFDESESGPDEEIGELRSETVNGIKDEYTFSWKVSFDELEEFEANRPYSLGYFIENQNYLDYVEFTGEIYIYF